MADDKKSEKKSSASMSPTSLGLLIGLGVIALLVMSQPSEGGSPGHRFKIGAFFEMFCPSL